MTVALVGFVAELNGSAGQLFEAAPVVRRDGVDYVAPSLDWKLDDLVKVQDSPHAVIHDVPGNRLINVGDTVWVAGSGFVTGIKDCGWVGDDAFRIGAWPTSRRGFRTGHGDRRAFDDLTHRLRVGLERSLHVALFDHMEIFMGEAPLLHELYAALPIEPDLEYQITRALYFDARRDDYSISHVRNETVYVFGLVSSEESFDALMNRRRDELETSRLGERAAAYATSLWPTASSFVTPSEVVAHLAQLAIAANPVGESAWMLVNAFQRLSPKSAPQLAEKLHDPSESDVHA